MAKRPSKIKIAQGIHAKTYSDRYGKINVKTIAFGNKEHTTD